MDGSLWHDTAPPPPAADPSRYNFFQVSKTLAWFLIVLIVAYIASIYSFDVQSRENRNHHYNLKLYSDYALKRISAYPNGHKEFDH